MSGWAPARSGEDSVDEVRCSITGRTMVEDRVLAMSKRMRSAKVFWLSGDFRKTKVRTSRILLITTSEES